MLIYFSDYYNVFKSGSSQLTTVLNLLTTNKPMHEIYLLVTYFGNRYRHKSRVSIVIARNDTIE